MKPVAWEPVVIRTILSGLVLVLTFLTMYLFAADAVADRYVLVRRRLEGRLLGAMNRGGGKNIFSYEHIQTRLDAWGVTYHSKGRITPTVYLSGKIFCAMAGLVAAFMLNPALIPLCVPAAFFYPDIHARLRNRSDNEKMLASIMDVYDVIFLQLNAGEYITQTLIDAYRVAAHPRLKAALITLTGDILSSSDLLVSIEVFAGKFENENINNLVVIVKQLIENGSSPAMLSDIRRYLVTLQESYNRYVQERTRRRGDACLFAIFFCIMAVMVYASVRGLLSSARLFNM